MATWQLSRRTLRRLKVGIGTILTLGFLYILPSILVSIPAIQSALAKRISKDLTQLFHTPVSLKSISIEGWRNINPRNCFSLFSSKYLFKGTTLNERLSIKRKTANIKSKTLPPS